MISKKELRARILLIVVCLAVGLYCLYSMDKSYDPLARYPYTTDENRDVLLKYLDSDDIDYFNNRMIRELSAYRLYDSRVWIPQAAALIDHKEMVEITHNLVMRRQKLRSRMEYNAGILKEQRTEVAKFMEEMPEMRPQIQDILDSVDRLSRP